MASAAKGPTKKNRRRIEGNADESMEHKTRTNVGKMTIMFDREAMVEACVYCLAYAIEEGPPGLGDVLDASAAQLRADGERIKALQAGIQAFLDGDYERPVGKEWRLDGKPSKHDRCVHDVWMYEYCEACADWHFEGLLNAARERQGEE